MPKSIKISLLATSVLLVLCIFLGTNAHRVRAAVGDAGDDAATQGAYRQINVYSEVLQHIQTDYVVVPNIPQVTDGALRGLLESLDADSSYLTPADYAAYKAGKGGKAQVGINVSKRFGYATVVSVVPNSPADKANLTDGDIIESVGNSEGKLVDTRNLSLAMIQMMMEGAPGTELHIGVIRPHKTDPDKITMNRVIVNEPPVSETLYENASILYLKPVILDKEHVNELEQRLKPAEKGNKKVLLDLRDVAAGDVPEAVRLANFFLKSGTITTLEGQKYPTQIFTADPGKVIDATGPLVVLVNRGTSGPAEIVAGAILDNKRGDLVGEKTFGEGSLQKTFDLPDGGAIILSVAKYASPSGKQFEDDAVTPTTLVASSNLPDADDDDDEDATPAPTPAKNAAPAPDDQLNKALSILKTKTA
jgi:carboxyl-terminal processing protease